MWLFLPIKNTKYVNVLQDCTSQYLSKSTFYSSTVKYNLFTEYSYIWQMGKKAAILQRLNHYPRTGCPIISYSAPVFSPCSLLPSHVLPFVFPVLPFSICPPDVPRLFSCPHNHLITCLSFSITWTSPPTHIPVPNCLIMPASIETFYFHQAPCRLVCFGSPVFVYVPATCICNLLSVPACLPVCSSILSTKICPFATWYLLLLPACAVHQL